MTPASPRWERRPPGSNWGDFGPDDQRGRLNLVTPDKVRQGIAEAREGLTFCLSLPLDRPGGDYHALNRRPPDLRAVRRNGRWAYNERPRPAQSDVWCDDAVLLHTQASTHWDALAHHGSAQGDGTPRYYNGYRAGADVPDPDAEGRVGARALGIERMAEACVQGRGVMIDLHAAHGAARARVGYEGLMRAMEAGGAVVERGDMVCLHTGLADALLACEGEPGTELLERSHAALDGRDARLLRWIDDSGLSAITADNFAVEAVPSRDDEASSVSEPLHELCLFKLGIHLGELWHLTPLNSWLKAHARTRFLLTAPPLRLPGAVGSPVTPVATV